MQQSPGGSKGTEDIETSKTQNTGTSSGPTDVLGNIGKSNKIIFNAAMGQGFHRLPL